MAPIRYTDKELDARYGTLEEVSPEEAKFAYWIVLAFSAVAAGIAWLVWKRKTKIIFVWFQPILIIPTIGKILIHGDTNSHRRGSKFIFHTG